jgi:hypothetical protein
MPVVRYGPVGRCVYCGEGEERVGKLSLEHIFPFSLGGTYELPEASCSTCAGIINSQIETPISGGDWGDLREKFRLPTRGKTSRTHVKVSDHFGRDLLIPLADFPTFAPSYRFGTARLISGSDAEQRREIHLLSEEAEKDALCKAKHPGWDGIYSFRAKNDRFARLLAKVAYGFTVAQFGSAWFRETITPIILGQVEDYTTHVGGDLDGYEWSEELNVAPNFKVRMIGPDLGLVVVDIAFVKDDPKSRYHVVVGECDISVDDVDQTVSFNADVRPRPTKSIRIERHPFDMGVQIGEVPTNLPPSAIRAAPDHPRILPGLPGGPSRT